MATARFAAMLEGITLKKDVKLTLVLTNPDEVLPSLVPMRAGRVVVLMRTEQQEIDDYNASLPPQTQQQLTFDETGFNVPADPGEAPDDEEQLMEEQDCPACGNLEPARQNCAVCDGLGVVPVDTKAISDPAPESEVAAGAEGQQPPDDGWTPQEPYVKPEQVAGESELTREGD